MRSLKNIALFIGLPLAMAAIAAFKSISDQRILKTIQTDTTGKGFAVVELFSSEGCSSCPPADHLMEKIQSKNNRQVYILVFHVDYWDHQGWKDRFSKAEFSERQKQYAHWLQTNNIYTPQIVINGEKEMVGSDESTVLASIQAALTGTSAPFSLSVKISGNKARVSYSYIHPKPGQNLLIALVKKQASSIISAGENSGRQLSHVQIVEEIRKFGLKSEDAVSLDCPANCRKGGWEIIGFIQDKSSGKITAAARTDL